MSAAWEAYARSRGLEFVPPRALKKSGRRPSMLVAGPVVRGVVSGVVVHVRSARSPEGLVSRVQGRAPIPVPLTLEARVRAGDAPLRSDLVPVELADATFDASFAVRASDAAVAARLLHDGLRVPLLELAAAHPTTLTYDRGIAVVSWPAGKGATAAREDELVDRALDVVVLACSFRPSESVYR